MNEEELIKHCQREVEIAERIKRYDKHYLEHKLVLEIINENKQLKDLITKLKNQPTVYLTKYLDKFGFVETKTLSELIDELEKGVINNE